MHSMYIPHANTVHMSHQGPSGDIHTTLLGAFVTKEGSVSHTDVLTRLG